MFLRFALIVVLSLTAAAQPSWQEAGACVTPQGSLCRTLVYESSGWANRSWGFHAVERYTERITEAAGSSGATLLRIVHRSFNYYFIPSESYDRTRIVIPAQRQTLEVDRGRREVRDLGGVWSFAEYWTDDVDCRKRAALAGENWRQTGERPIAAGLRAIEYSYESSDHRVEQRIAFSPEIGCTAVRFSLFRRNAAGLPVSEDRLMLVAATLGEPDPTLFSVPAEFRRVGVDRSWPYVRMDKYPGAITTTGFSRPVP